MHKIIPALLAFLTAAATVALEPPPRGALRPLDTRHDLQERVAFAAGLGNHRLALVAPGIKAEGVGGLPTTGTVRVLALLVDFPDTPHTISAAVIDSMLFGSGNPAGFPKDSLRQFYLRSSYGQLEIQGRTLGWYTASQPRTYYTDRAGLLIQEALGHFDAQGHDFTVYDNDGDDAIDSINVFWSGAVGQWATFWWGYASAFPAGGDPNFRVDGKSPGRFTWLHEDTSPAGVIHETGHVLGLPDYYDYDESVGPSGGVGDMDVMAGERGDHNGYSKWLLGWLTPHVVSGATPANLSLAASASSAEGTVVIGAQQSSPHQEFFLVQNRTRTGNDSTMPGDGVLVFHVDGRLGCDGSSRMFDNSFTEHKLLRLVEADGADDIERKVDWGTADDYFRAGGTAAFGPFTSPASDRYDGSTTGVLVDAISAPGQVMTAVARVLPLAAAAAPVVLMPAPGSVTAGLTPRITWGHVPGAGGYQVELRSGLNRLYRARIPASEHAHQVPSGILAGHGTFGLSIRALANGSTTGSGPFQRAYFSTRPCTPARWVARTFANLCCGVTLDHPGVAFDPTAEVTVLFGGGSSSATYEYDGSGWHAHATTPAPAPRYYPVLVSDPAGGGVLLFGGLSHPDYQGLGDTWRYRPASHTWEQLAPAASPPVNWTWKAAADTGRGVVVLVSSSGTWEWNGARWRQAGPGSGAPQVYLHAAAYDERRGRTVVFGGDRGGGAALSDSTWEYDGATWTPTTTSARPPARVDHALVYSRTAGVVLAFGGRSASAPLSDVWAWDGSTWSEVTACDSQPPVRWSDWAIYDARRDTVVTGGWAGELATWELQFESPVPIHRVRRQLRRR